MSYRSISLRLTVLLVAILWATSAAAQFRNHPISGNFRFQIGNGLPIPITLIPPPNGGIVGTPNATIKQGTVGKTIVIASPIATAPLSARTIGVFQANNNVFQVRTSIGFNLITTGPNAAREGWWAPGGRTGPATVTWCPGSPLPTAAVGTRCTAGPTGRQVPGQMRYVSTGNQFGGVSQGTLSGGTVGVAAKGAIVHLRATGTAPCHNVTNGPCQAAVNYVSVNAKGAQGGPFGTTVTTPGFAPNPGVFGIGANGNGTVTTILTTFPVPGVTNRPTSYGGPWTTGMLTVSAVSTAGMGTEIFTRTGSDNRTSALGAGTISLVSAAVSNRTLSKPNANRGWANLTIGAPVPEPAAMAATAGMLVMLGACHRVVRRRRNR